MKKVLGLCLVVLLVILAVFTVSAETNEVDTLYKDEIFELLGWEDDDTFEIDYRCMMTYNADGSIASDDDADYMLGFAHRYDDPRGVIYIGNVEFYGNYQVNYPELYIPGLFIYSVKENKIYSIREAWTQKLPNIETALKKAGRKVWFYADIFEEYLAPLGERYEQHESSWYYIEELYYYDSSLGGVMGGQRELPKINPDYALVRIHAVYGIPNTNVLSVCGGYVVDSTYGRPNPLQYYVYTPKDDKIYTLNEAYDAGIENIDRVFTDYGLGRLIGDLDYDGELTILDATRMQLALVGKGFSLPRNEDGVYDESSEPKGWIPNIADFDFSNRLNILDVIAIQNKLVCLI